MRATLAALALVALVVAGCLQGPGTPPSTVHFKGTDLSGNAIAPFTLTRSDNTSFTLEQLRGKVVIVLFIWTHCPDVCPITTSLTAQVLQLVGDDYPASVAVVSISIDPYRDTPEELAAYQKARSVTWTHLTGSRAQLEPIWADFGLYVDFPRLNDSQIAAVRAQTTASHGHVGFPQYNQSSGVVNHSADPNDWLNYSVSHSAATFLLDQQLQRRVLWSGWQWPPEDVAADVQKLVLVGP